MTFKGKHTLSRCEQRAKNSDQPQLSFCTGWQHPFLWTKIVAAQAKLKTWSAAEIVKYLHKTYPQDFASKGGLHKGTIHKWIVRDLDGNKGWSASTLCCAQNGGRIGAVSRSKILVRFCQWFSISMANWDSHSLNSHNIQQLQMQLSRNFKLYDLQGFLFMSHLHVQLLGHISSTELLTSWLLTLPLHSLFQHLGYINSCKMSSTGNSEQAPVLREKSLKMLVSFASSHFSAFPLLWNLIAFMLH